MCDVVLSPPFIKCFTCWCLGSRVIISGVCCKQQQAVTITGGGDGHSDRLPAEGVCDSDAHHGPGGAAAQSDSRAIDRSLMLARKRIRACWLLVSTPNPTDKHKRNPSACTGLLLHSEQSPLVHRCDRCRLRVRLAYNQLPKKPKLAGAQGQHACTVVGGTSNVGAVFTPGG